MVSFLNKTVIRAGFGTYLRAAGLSELSPRPKPAFQHRYSRSRANRSRATSPLLPYVPGGALPSGALISPSGVQPNLKTPTVESYTLKIEQQICA